MSQGSGLNESSVIFLRIESCGVTDNDCIFGDADSGVLFGNSGNDLLVGGGGTELIFGNSNDDKLYGGGGVDLLFGNGECIVTPPPKAAFPL